jgi:acyl-coenzyme A thioesterase PaaI-like protein
MSGPAAKRSRIRPASAAGAGPAGQEPHIEGLARVTRTNSTGSSIAFLGSPGREAFRPAGFLHGGAIATIVASCGLVGVRELTTLALPRLRSLRLAFYAPSSSATIGVRVSRIGLYDVGAALAIELVGADGSLLSVATACYETDRSAGQDRRAEKPSPECQRLAEASRTPAADATMSSEPWRHHLGIRAHCLADRCAISSAPPDGEWQSLAVVCTVADTVGVLLDQFRTADRDFVTTELALEQFRAAHGIVAAEGRLVRQTGRLTSLVSSLYDQRGLLGVGGATYSATRKPGSG